jgi:hypothetical protein
LGCPHITQGCNHSQAPLVLTVLVKRYHVANGVTVKSVAPLEFSETLEVSELNVPRPYQLCAVVVHSGASPSDGHTYAYTKTRSGGWCKADDDKVNSVGFGTVRADVPYVLVYCQTATSRGSAAPVPTAQPISAPSVVTEEPDSEPTAAVPVAAAGKHNPWKHGGEMVVLASTKKRNRVDVGLLRKGATSETWTGDKVEAAKTPRKRRILDEQELTNDRDVWNALLDQGKVRVLPSFPL